MSAALHTCPNWTLVAVHVLQPSVYRFYGTVVNQPNFNGTPKQLETVEEPDNKAVQKVSVMTHLFTIACASCIHVVYILLDVSAGAHAITVRDTVKHLCGERICISTCGFATSHADVNMYLVTLAAQRARHLQRHICT
jgi:hypothetical protein